MKDVKTTATDSSSVRTGTDDFRQLDKAATERTGGGENITYAKFIPNFLKDKVKLWLVNRTVKGDVESSQFKYSKFDVTVEEGGIICQNCEIGEANLSLGRYSVLNKNCEVKGEVEIGDFTAIARNCVLQAYNHPMDKTGICAHHYQEHLDLDLGLEEQKIKIGSNAWIGTRVIVLPGVEIGDGAIVGAGAVVAKDVEPFEIVGGVPAERIGMRGDEDYRKAMLELEWWNWDLAKIEDNKEKLFENSEVKRVEAE